YQILPLDRCAAGRHRPLRRRALKRVGSAARAAISLSVLGCGSASRAGLPRSMTTASCRTLERDHQVAFFAIEGTLAHRETPAVHAIVETTRGVDESSVRVSAELVAFDAGHPLVD